MFPGLNKALLSIGTLCNHGCQSKFYEKSVRILKRGSGKLIMNGTRDTRSNMYMINLTKKKKLMTEFTTPDEYLAGSAYDCKSKGTLVDYHHVSCWRHNQSGWGKAITKTFHFLARPIIWPGAEIFIPKKSTILGRLQQPRKGLWSTQEKVLQSKPDPEQEQFPSSMQSGETNLVFLKTVYLTGKLYTDQTGRFQVTSSKGNKYILVA